VVVVSGGELVEIGGSFRVPDVMERAGARLREVGTTNRTRMDDYKRAAGPATAMLMKVHTSNFRVRGFTHEVTADELSVLGAELGLATCFDLGSGLLELPDMRPLALGDEPRVRDAVSSGVDLVTFSGDKLLGAPQAGLVVGKRAAVRALRANPMYRAMRCDKVTLAGLERTFALLLSGRGDELPARRMLLATAAELHPAAERLAAGIAALGPFAAEVRPERSQPGSGSAPDVYLDTYCVRVADRRRSAGELARLLRRGDPPLFARVQEDALWLDPRTLLDGDLEGALSAFGALA
jgi:L-seryl-tRNA(Ser) seleniumtransferase